MKYLDDRDPSPTATEIARMERKSQRIDEREVQEAKLKRLFERGYFVAHKALGDVINLKA